MYDDTYATCARTHATLLIYPGEVDPSVITDRLGIEPSSWQRRGEVAVQPGQPTSKRLATMNGWFLTSKGRVHSRDSRRHVDWLLNRVASKGEAIRALQALGCTMSISCSWLQLSGQGGPTVSPSQMKGLGDLNIELWFDIYGPTGEEPLYDFVGPIQPYWDPTAPDY